MVWLLISLLVLGLLAAFLGWYSGHKDEEQPEVTAATCATCNGNNDRCEQDCMMEAATKPIEYFDDEELDQFKGRSSDSYSEEEVELFDYVLNTMQQSDLAPWCRSLTLRGIELPDQLKDEIVSMLE